MAGEAFDHGLREALSPGVLDVLLVFLDEVVRVMDELLGHLDQGLILLRTQEVGHSRCRLFGVLRNLEDLLLDVHGYSAKQELGYWVLWSLVPSYLLFTQTFNTQTLLSVTC